MTIAATITAKQYTGNGVTTQFAFPNKIFAAADLVVTIIDNLGNQYPFVNFVQATLGLTYTVQGVDVDTGAIVVLSGPLTNLWTIDIRSLIPDLQSTSIKNQGSFFPELHEEALDRATRMIQDVLRLSYLYGIHGPDIEAVPWPALPGIAARKGLALMFDAVTGLPTTGVPTTQTLTQALIGTLLYPQTAAELAAGVTPTNYAYVSGDVRRYGCTANDGVTDESTKFQNAVNGNKGGTVVVPAGLTVVAAGILLNGSTYNNTTIQVLGTFRLGVQPNRTTTNFQGYWLGIIVELCDNVTIDVVDADGNRANQPQFEDCTLLGLAGSSNTKIPRFYAREVRGDGIIINTSDYTAVTAGTNTTDLIVGQVRVVNTAIDGRNAVSIISCDGFVISSVYSKNVGGTVFGVQEPGGLDIEPNSGPNNLIRNGSVGTVTAIGAMAFGFSVAGQSIGGADANDWNITDLNIGSVNVIYTGAVNWSGNPLRRHLRVTIGEYRKFGNSATAGLFLDHCQFFRGKFYFYNCASGTVPVVQIGSAGTMTDSIFEADVYGYGGAALVTTGVNFSSIKARIRGALNASTTFGLYIRPLTRTITQIGVIYSIDAPYDGQIARACFIEGTDAGTMTYGAGTCIRDSDWTGYSNVNLTLDGTVGANINLPTINIRGRNLAAGLTAAPATGKWAQFDEVVLDQTTASAISRVKCIASGAPGTWVGVSQVNAAALVTTAVAMNNGAAATSPTLGAAGPAGATTPTKWLPINDNGTTRYIPSW